MGQGSGDEAQEGEMFYGLAKFCNTFWLSNSVTGDDISELAANMYFALRNRR